MKNRIFKEGGGAGLGSRIIPINKQENGSYITDVYWPELIGSFEHGESLYLAITDGDAVSLITLEGRREGNSYSFYGIDDATNLIYTITQDPENNRIAFIQEDEGKSGKEYTAGNGLILDGDDQFAIDEEIVATKQDIKHKQDELIPGANITIFKDPETGINIISASASIINLENGSGDKSLLQTPRYETFTGLDGETYPVDAAGQASVVLGGKGYADPNSKYAFVMGTGNVTKTGCTTVIGDNCLVDNIEENGSTIESFGTFVTGYANHVSGSAYSIVGGKENTVYDAVQSFIVGSSNEAYGHNVFVEGHENFNGDLSGSPVEGTHGEGSHVAGIGNKNDSFYSFITGVRNQNVSGDYSFVAGLENNIDDSKYSFVAGIRNTSHNAQGQTVFGQYNNNKTDSLFEIGGGENEDLRKNAFRVDKTGNIYFNDDQYSIVNGYFNGNAQSAVNCDYANNAQNAVHANGADSAGIASYANTCDSATSANTAN